MRRFAAVMNHRSAGFKANAMGVWAVPDAELDEIGPQMAGFALVSHCYRRPTYDDWPYSIFTMVHGKNAKECEATIAAIHDETGVDEYALLWSIKEYKKTRVRYYTDDWDDWRAAHLTPAVLSRRRSRDRRRPGPGRHARMPRRRPPQQRGRRASATRRRRHRRSSTSSSRRASAATRPPTPSPTGRPRCTTRSRRCSAPRPTRSRWSRTRRARGTWRSTRWRASFAPGDRILTSRAEYASNVIGVAAGRAAHRRGGRWSCPTTSPGQLSVDALRDMLDDRVRLVAIVVDPDPGRAGEPGRRGRRGRARGRRAVPARRLPGRRAAPGRRRRARLRLPLGDRSQVPAGAARHRVPLRAASRGSTGSSRRSSTCTRRGGRPATRSRCATTPAGSRAGSTASPTGSGWARRSTTRWRSAPTRSRRGSWRSASVAARAAGARCPGSRCTTAGVEQCGIVTFTIDGVDPYELAARLRDGGDQHLGVDHRLRPLRLRGARARGGRARVGALLQHRGRARLAVVVRRAARRAPGRRLAGRGDAAAP